KSHITLTIRTCWILMATLALATLCMTEAMAGRSNMMKVSEESGAYTLFANGKASNIFVSDTEPIAVRTAARLLADDVERVTGVRPRITGKAGKRDIIIGTLGHNRTIDRMASKGQLDVSTISGGWEQYVMKVADGRLVIAGCDARGAAYGALSLSEAMGVSPWYWWADVPVKHRKAVYVDADCVSKAPTVKYRGVFINDEDWGMKTWAEKNFERNLGDIGPRTYSKVCELLLRLKTNMLAPAMHSCTGAFYSHKESKVVADSFGIIITTSHCEPLLLNNAAKSEWDMKRDGDWNYKTNRETILRKWNDRLAEAAQYENIYTVAMRGLHDAGLRGNLPMKERVTLIDTVIRDQRRLLEKHTGRKATDIPQIFVPYKETMDIYENGLQVPEDITLVWVDDNYGYMKRVSSPKEQQRSGGAGVYYHLSYLGAPHDYLWLNTTPPVLMYEELKKAYDTGADRYWLLNVGDIKPMELGIQTFAEMAWDINAFNIDNVNRHQSEWLKGLFGGEWQEILDDYYRLAWSRKPEFMGWEYEWDDKDHTGLKPTEFSFRHYDEAQRRLADYERISNEVERRSDGTDAYFQLVQYPIQAAYQMTRKFLMAQLNGELISEGRKAEANWAARQMEAAYDSISSLNRRYNSMSGGKWNEMMNLPTGWCALYHKKPAVTYSDRAGEKSVDLTPQAINATAEGNGGQCHVVDLGRYSTKSEGVNLVRGLGYDWQTVQLNSGDVTYTFPAVTQDSVEITLYTVPFWPLHEGKGNAVAVSVDGKGRQVFSNRFREYDRTWKDQVMRNGAICRMTFAVDKSRREHTITLHTVDAGQMVQRIIIDWGGLRKSYIGPNPTDR
ncbi:MAG: glycosyl hydrolase 115 family protein, partial [Prevotellaceae bacterium]|nr:glycosyl hydrolase 115 family protein [Prevotellaceae bacterium]